MEKQLKIDEKIQFLCNHPSLTLGFNRATLNVINYGSFYIIDLKHIKFEENSFDLHFSDVKITVTDSTYSRTIDKLYYKVLDEYGGYVDYGYDDTLYNITRIETYNIMKNRIDDLIEKTTRALN